MIVIDKNTQQEYEVIQVMTAIDPVTLQSIKLYIVNYNGAERAIREENVQVKADKILCDDCMKYNKCKMHNISLDAVSCSLYWKNPKTFKEWFKWFYIHKIWSPYRYYKYHYLRDKWHIIK